MYFFLLLLTLFAPIPPLGAQDANQDAVVTRQSYPCSLAEGSCSTDFVFDLMPEDRRGMRRQWMIWLDTTVFYDAQHRLTYPGVLEWSVTIWNGRVWEPESRFISAPWGRENTTAILVNKSTRVRVKVKLANGWRPPAVDVPVNALTQSEPVT